MAELLNTLSIISFAVAGVCFVLAVFLWFIFRIPTVIGDLSGRTARKSIAKMRATNEKTGVKSYKESKINLERGKVTETIPNMSNPPQQAPAPATPPVPASNVEQETGVLANNRVEGFETEMTGVLNQEPAYVGSEPTGLLFDENATAPLAPPAPPVPARAAGKTLEMLETVMIIHTNEVI